jgi:hypothetical protein
VYECEKISPHRELGFKTGQNALLNLSGCSRVLRGQPCCTDRRQSPFCAARKTRWSSSSMDEADTRTSRGDPSHQDWPHSKQPPPGGGIHDGCFRPRVSQFWYGPSDGNSLYALIFLVNNRETLVCRKSRQYFCTREAHSRWSSGLAYKVWH